MRAAQIVSQHSPVYPIVADRINKQLKSGVTPCSRLWRKEPPRNLVSSIEYLRINPFLLASQGYGSRHLLKYNQAHKLGGPIHNGEKASYQQNSNFTLGARESIEMTLPRAREIGSKRSGKISRHEKNGQAIRRSLRYTGQTFKNLGNASEDLAMRFGQLLTPAELAVRLKVSVGWIYEKRRPRCKKPIPAIPMGRTMRFDWFAVTKWLEELAAEDAKDLQQRRAGIPTNTARNSLLKK